MKRIYVCDFVYMCMYVCMYVCIRVYACVCIYMYMCMCLLNNNCYGYMKCLDAWMPGYHCNSTSSPLSFSFFFTRASIQGPSSGPGIIIITIKIIIIVIIIDVTTIIK